MASEFEDRVTSNGRENPLKEDFEELGKMGQRFASDSLHQIRRGFNKVYNKGRAQISGIEKKIEGNVREYPLQTLLVAAGIGFLVGMLRKKNS